ncbi:hypothetical protein E2C01_062163 [Portunus trituberculatus]|uniref:Uncharacterized protein n=1 Tax=Portunus trituberculatus TaxID=210409 RepID=A0A5B7HED4_PORTR|nr:hypothetical protein [Portunus trituberculatus]
MHGVRCPLTTLPIQYTRTTPATPPRNTHYTFTREPSHPHTVYLPSPTHAHLKSRISTAGNVQRLLFMVIKVRPCVGDQHQAASPRRGGTPLPLASLTPLLQFTTAAAAAAAAASCPADQWHQLPCGGGGTPPHCHGPRTRSVLSARSTPTRRVGGAGLGRPRGTQRGAGVHWSYEKITTNLTSHGTVT